MTGRSRKSSKVESSNSHGKRNCESSFSEGILFISKVLKKKYYLGKKLNSGMINFGVIY